MVRSPNKVRRNKTKEAGTRKGARGVNVLCVEERFHSGRTQRGQETTALPFEWEAKAVTPKAPCRL